MELAQVQELSSEVLDEVEKAVVGKREALELVWLGFLADGHVLLEDYPGLAKTLAARSFAQVLSMRFSRIQFTPDLMPSDVTGSSIWNQRDGDFEFRPGPIFTNLLLSDEINRAPPKTQAALLEAMQERQVTIEGVTHVLEPPFLVIATQNPIEYEGTYPLPEAQLDRFLLRTAFGYPSREGEVDVLARRIERESDDVELRPVVDRETLLSMQRAIERVYVATSVQEYCVDLVAATRASPSTAVGASPRGSLALLKLARCRAALQSRDYVAPGRRQGDRGSGTRPPPRPPPGALGAARLVRGRRSGGARDRSDTPGGRRHGRATHVTRTASPRLIGYASLAAVGLVAALALRRPELAVVAAPFALFLAIGTRAAREPRITVELELEAERALEGTEVGAVFTVDTDRSIDRLELLLRLPQAVEVGRRLAGPRSAPSSRRDPRAARRPALRALGRLRPRPRGHPSSRRAPARHVGGALRAHAATQGVSEPAHDPAAPRAARDASARGQRGCAREGRGRRVRRHPRLRSRRSRPLDQLARFGAPAGPRRERAPSGAQHGRRAVHRQLH